MGHAKLNEIELAPSHMTASTQETTGSASQNQMNEENQKKFNDMRKVVEEQEARRQNLQNVAFQLGNYYFVFQGVILAAISNASSLTCSDRWFVFALSLLAAIVNLAALFIIGKRYIDISVQFDKTWSEYNDLMRRLSPSPQKPSAISRMFSPLRKFPPQQKIDRVERVEDQHRTSETEEKPWEDQYAKTKRYLFLCVCMLLFLGFAGVIFYGCWQILCRHEDCRHQPHHNHNVNCFKFCNGSKCMMLCNDFM